MKKIIYLSLLFFISYNISYADYGNVTINPLANAENNCSVSVNARYYLGGTTYMYDLLGHRNGVINDWFIGFSSSKIGIYNPNNNIRVNGGFQFTSRLLPSTETSIVPVFNLGGTNILNHPATRNDLAAQIVYEISVAPKVSGPKSGNFGYSTYYNNTWENKSINLNNFGVDISAISLDKECFNVYVSWCGDGTIDSGETCDNGALNGTAGNSCSSTCTTIPGGGGSSCTNGGVSGVQSAPINASTTGLCQAGTTLDVGSFISSVSGNITNYTWSCSGLSGGTCSASYSTGGGGTPLSSGGGGGSSSTCYSLTTTNTSGGSPLISSFSCNGSSNQYTIDIRNTTGGANNLIHTFTNTGGTYTFNGNGTYTAQCYVGPTNATDITNCKKTISVGAGSSSVGGLTTGGICGDGILQRTNSGGINEECDFGTNPWPAWCSQSNCQIIENTIPGGGNINIIPAGDLLLGHGMSVFGNLNSSNAIIQNNSTSNIYIDKPICVYKKNTSYNVIDGNDICSSNVIGLLNKSGGSKQINIDNNQFVANIGNLPNGIDFGTAEIITTLQGLQDMDTFLKSILTVRVAKPTVSTLGGGASLLNGTNYSDIYNLSGGGFALLKPAVNKNLILSSLGINPLSSYVKSSNNVNILNISKQEGNDEINNFTGVTSNLGSITINNLPTQNFNSFDNVFIHKGNVNLDSQNISGGNKTYVIQDGNLIINGDISSTNNILFVVKNGNIIIKNSVANIDAILIDIGGNISGETISTQNRLVVNGALYGDVSGLLSKRTYIKDRGEYVDVGTNINFTSKIFNSPPPLLSRFLGEYTERKKVPN